MVQAVCDRCGKVVEEEKFKVIPIYIGGYKTEGGEQGDR